MIDYIPVDYLNRGNYCVEKPSAEGKVNWGHQVGNRGFELSNCEGF